MTSHDPADFADFAAALGPDASRAHADPDIADAYWRARRTGHGHPATLATTRSLNTASNPLGLVLTRLRRLADTQPPQRRTVGRHGLVHDPCPDGHPGCVLCRCTPGRTSHHQPTPAPDWFHHQVHQAIAGTRLPDDTEGAA